jgi:hypothetical protein
MDTCLNLSVKHYYDFLSGRFSSRQEAWATRSALVDRARLLPRWSELHHAPRRECRPVAEAVNRAAPTRPEARWRGSSAAADIAQICIEINLDRNPRGSP